VTEIIRMIKNITDKKIFEKHPEVKKQLWGGEFWLDGFFVNTVSKFGSEDTISKYVRNQGIEKEYKKYTISKLACFRGNRYPVALLRGDSFRKRVSLDRLPTPKKLL